MDPKLTLSQAYLIFNSIKGLGAATAHKIINAFDNDPLIAVKLLKEKKRPVIEGVRSSSLDILSNWAKHFHLEEEENKLKKHQAAFVSYQEDDYPPYLKEIYDPPVGLYCLGNFRPKHANVAIVGSRRCTLYGRSVAKKIAGDLAQRGFCVVSGMARGIDTAAHEGALEVGGKTAAVLGCGLDVIYPQENKELYHRIAASGVVMSEFPFGQSGDKYTFPMRNRIVSGISQAVIVVETDEKGGSLITARLAGEQGRHVFAVPGRIDQATSRGCHQLIRDGATLLSSVEDLLQELTYLDQMVSRLEGSEEVVIQNENQTNLSGLSDTERTVLNLLSDGTAFGIDDIADTTSLSIPDVSSALLMLELKACVAKRVDGKFEVVPQI